MLLRYVHYELNEEVTALGGHYVISKEVRLLVDDREVLYTVGYGVMDTTCCGMGGCAYATVHGFIKQWRYLQNDKGLAVTEIESIEDESLRSQLRRKIMGDETVQQVNFL
jgi:hypothetical protein